MVHGMHPRQTQGMTTHTAPRSLTAALTVAAYSISALALTGTAYLTTGILAGLIH